MRAPREIEDFSSEELLTFLEHLAHELTIAVRVAMHDCEPYGSLSEQQCRRAMYWVNEATHEVVQFTRQLRLGLDPCGPQYVAECVERWMRHAPRTAYVQVAVERANYHTLNP